MRTHNERGIAMVSVLLVMMLVSALLIGFTAMTMSDQRFRFIDRDRMQSFYGASAGLEKMTADLGNLFFVYVAPTTAQIATLAAAPPTMPGLLFTKSDGTTGYQIASQYLGTTTVSTGPYQGLYGLITLYTMDVTARTTTGGDTHLQRQTETVAIPVFQFGIFSDVDLSFFAGPNFNFGGRVHTNGNLFLAEGDGSILALSDKVTAVKEVVRKQMQNGALISDAPSHQGTVNMAYSTGNPAAIPPTPPPYRALLATEGSVVNTIGLGVLANEPPNAAPGVSWSTLSLSTYNAFIRSRTTGARVLNLPLVSMGGTNVDLTRRPVPSENTNNPTLFAERDFGKVSLRILLSDTAADITNLQPMVSAGAPVSLEAGASFGGFPVATSAGPLPVAATTTAATNLNDTTLTVNAMPAWYAKPKLTAKNGATYKTGPFTCTTWNETSLTGCNHAMTLSAGWTLYVGPANTVALNPGNMPGNPNPSLTLAAAVSGTNPATRVMTFVAGQDTWDFAANTFWLTDIGAMGTGLSTQVTCTGATGNQFTGCSGVPAAKSGATVTTGYLSNQGIGTLGGFIKAEMQKADGTGWLDVTAELLGYGISGPNIDGAPCGDPTPKAILRMQRLRDNALPVVSSCPVNNLNLNPYESWPNTLFDTREGLQRDCGTGATCTAAGKVVLGGVMHYATIDVANLSDWFKCTAPFNVGACSGLTAAGIGGYSVYFSDRRNNTRVGVLETGEYSWEDFVNPASPTGAPNGTLDAGEDVNASGLLETDGQFPRYNGAIGAPPGAATPLLSTARPTTTLTGAEAQVNRAILFRRALKLTRGGLGNIVMPGLTIAAENPVYVQGNWNMAQNPPPANDGHAATSVLGDAVTLLSNEWDDNNSFTSPYDMTGTAQRKRTTASFYRLAIVSGKGMAFPQPNGTPSDFGTDGGAHNFLRYLEQDGGQAVNYQGSIITFFYNRQSVGTYKCCTTVYTAPTRNYAFDVDFLDPAKLPPLTPVFRDVNTIGFSQEIRPGR